jgi:hypothetical protein
MEAIQSVQGGCTYFGSYLTYDHQGEEDGDMGKYVLAYTGGGMGESEAEQQEAMTQWMNWFGSLGAAVVDGGSPFGPASTIASDGAVSEGGRSALTGYSIIEAGSLAEACDQAKGCPVLTSGGAIEVYESLPVG